MGPEIQGDQCTGRRRLPYRHEHSWVVVIDVLLSIISGQVVQSFPWLFFSLTALSVRMCHHETTVGIHIFIRDRWLRTVPNNAVD